MKSSDCVIKHAGVYSTGLAMVVCIQNDSFCKYNILLCPSFSTKGKQVYTAIAHGTLRLFSHCPITLLNISIFPFWIEFLQTLAGSLLPRAEEAS